MEKELYNFYLEGEVTFMQVYKVERAQSQDLNPNLDRHGCKSWLCFLGFFTYKILWGLLEMRYAKYLIVSGLLFSKS